MPTRVGSLIWNRINPTNKKCFGTVSPLCHCPGLVEGFCKIQRKRKYIVQRRKEVQAWGLTGITQTTCTHMLPLSVCTSHFILWMFVFLTLVPCVCPTTQPLSSENWTGTLHNPAEERAGSDTRDPQETSSYLPGLSTWQCAHCEALWKIQKMHVQTLVLRMSFALLSQSATLSAHLGFAGRSFFLTSGPKLSGTATWKNCVSKVTLSAWNLSAGKSRGLGDSWVTPMSQSHCPTHRLVYAN